MSGRHVNAKYLDNVHKQRRYTNEGEIRKPLGDQPPAPDDVDLPPDIAITKAKIALEDLAIKQIQREREDLELKKLQGEFVPFAEVENEAKSAWIAYRTKTLGLPMKFRSRHPSVSLEAIDDLEAICHEMLHELVREQANPEEDDEDGEGT